MMLDGDYQNKIHVNDHKNMRQGKSIQVLFQNKTKGDQLTDEVILPALGVNSAAWG